MGAKGNAPVIIKRRKIVAGDGHHGGAWKIAYADFVTAMMAFFMLMWLLNATTEKQRKGIADYFNPTIPVNRISGGGDSVFGGESVFVEETLAHEETGGTGDRQDEAMGARFDSELLASIENALTARGGESMATDFLQRHIVTRVTDEGLIVELSDQPGAPLFVGDTAEPTELLAALVDLVAKVFGMSTNPVAIAAHVASRPVVLRTNPSWELTADRAQRVREMIEAAGLDPGRVRRIEGHGDRAPAVLPAIDLTNNRIGVVLLRSRF